MSHECTNTKNNSLMAMSAWAWGSLAKVVKKATVAMIAIAATASVAHADTLLMPNRDFLMGTPEVVWGVSTQANGAAYSINYGDGSAVASGTVADRCLMA